MPVIITEDIRKQILTTIKNVVEFQHGLDILNRNCDVTIDALGEFLATGDMGEDTVENLAKIIDETERAELIKYNKAISESLDKLKNLVGT